MGEKKLMEKKECERERKCERRQNERRVRREGEREKEEEMGKINWRNCRSAELRLRQKSEFRRNRFFGLQLRNASLLDSMSL